MTPAATMRTLRSAPAGLGRSPLKAALLLATIALGVAATISALSISSALNRLMVERLERDGLVVAIYGSSGSADPGSPEYPLNQRAVDTLLSDVNGAAAASLVRPLDSDEYVLGGTIYQVRTAVAASDAYLQVMGLNIFAGSNVEAPNHAVISATLADVLYGSAAVALGQTLQTASPRMTRGNMTREQAAAMRRAFMPAYTVRGVFRDPDELRRRVYGIADMVVGLDADPDRHRYSIRLRVTGARLGAIRFQVRAALARQYGYEVAVAVEQEDDWSAFHDLDPRSTVQTLSLILNLLAVLILVTGGVGLLSLMMVEVLSRSRQIALSRAFGASKRSIAAEFLVWSVVMAAAAAVIGVVLSLFLSGPLTELVTAVFRDAADIDLTGPVITPAAVAAGVAAAIGIGGLLGPLPVFSALAAPIAEGIRDA